jgi:hypothetical protein
MTSRTPRLKKRSRCGLVPLALALVTFPAGSLSAQEFRRLTDGEINQLIAGKTVCKAIRGAYAAAIGTILGACVLLGKIAIGDWLIALIGIASLAVLFRWKVSNPLLIGVTAIIGLIAYPILQPAWVMVR